MWAWTGGYAFDYGHMGMKKINEIPSKNWLILKWLYLCNRLTDFDALTWEKALDVYFNSGMTAHPSDPYNQRNSDAASF